VICPTCGLPQLSERPHLHRVVPATDPLDVTPIDDDRVVRATCWLQVFALATIAGIVFGLGFFAGRATAAPRSGPDSTARALVDQGRTGAPLERVVLPRTPPSVTPVPTLPATTAAPLELVTRTGIASTYGPGWDGWTATPWPRGTTIRICGPGGCAERLTNDVGPNQRIHPDRVVDLDVATFELVCAVSWRMGLCDVSVTVIRHG